MCSYRDRAEDFAALDAVVVIDEEGVVRHRHDHLLGLDYQSVDDLKVALDALPARTAS
jgi:hypothetical protein